MRILRDHVRTVKKARGCGGTEVAGSQRARLVDGHVVIASAQIESSFAFRDQIPGRDFVRMGEVGVLGDCRNHGPRRQFHCPHDHVPVVEQPRITGFPDGFEIPCGHFPHRSDQEIPGVLRRCPTAAENGFAYRSGVFKGHVRAPRLGESLFRSVFCAQPCRKRFPEAFDLLGIAQTEVLFVEKVDKSDRRFIFQFRSGVRIFPVHQIIHRNFPVLPEFRVEQQLVFSEFVRTFQIRH